MRGPELKSAYDAYQLWVQKTKAEKQTAYAAVKKGDRAKYDRLDCWLAPFGAPANFYILVQGIAESVTAAPAPAVVAGVQDANRLRYEAPTGTTLTIIRLPKAKLAKVTITKRVGTTATQTASRITGASYTHYETNTASSVFGASTTTEDYDAAVTAIRAVALVKTEAEGIGGSVRFAPQATVF